MIKNKNLLLASGQISLTISFGLKHFLAATQIVDFLCGFTLGLSLVFNIAYLVLVKKQAAVN